MSEMVERLAQVLLNAEAKHEGMEGTVAYSFAEQGEEFQEGYRAMVRAVLQELRDNPTEAMIRAGHAGAPECARMDWRNMINKALEE